MPRRLAAAMCLLLALGAEAGPRAYRRDRRPRGGRRVGTRLAVLPGGPMASYVAAGQLNGSWGEAVTFTRGSTALQMNASGCLTTIASGSPRVETSGFLAEQPATNLLLWNRDLTNAAWTKTNATAALTATGADCVANSASTITATAGNATVLQTLTTGAATRSSSLYLKRRTGTGTINVTRDNGTTWTDVTASLSSTAWFRVTPATHAAMSSGGANPVVGIRIVTSGDAVDVDYAQDEAGTWASSPIPTTTAQVTRSRDVAFAVPAVMPATVGSISVDFTQVGSTIDNMFLADTRAAGSTGPGFSLEGSLSSINFRITDGASAQSAVAASLGITVGSTHRLCGTWNGTSAKIYFDGVLKGSISNAPDMTGMARMYIASRSDGAGFTSMNVSNVRLSSVDSCP